jgi:hypothetical protein
MKLNKDVLLAVAAILGLGAIAFFMNNKEEDVTNTIIKHWQDLGYFVHFTSSWDNVHERTMHTVYVITPTYEYFVTDFSKKEAVQAIKDMMYA